MAGDNPVPKKPSIPPPGGDGARRSLLPEDRKLVQPSNGTGEGEQRAQPQTDGGSSSRDLLRQREAGTPASSPEADGKGPLLRLDQVPPERFHPSKVWSREEVERAWATLDESRLTGGQRLAKEAGYPPAEPDYHWADIANRPLPTYRRNSERSGEPNPNNIRVFNPETRRFEDVLSASQVAEALHLPDAPEGYYWSLDRRGILSVEREFTNLPPKVYDASINDFVLRGKEITEPLFGRQEIIALSSLDEAAVREMQRLVDVRSQARQKRDRLEIQEGSSSASGADLPELAAQPTDQAQRALREARYAVNEASRLLGERAAEAYMLSQRAAEVYMIRTYGDAPGVAKIYQLADIGSPDAPSRPGDFDQVWEVVNRPDVPPLADASSWMVYRDGTTLVLIEAKGGTSPLGTRDVKGDDGQVRTCRQGSLPYLIDIANAMARSSDQHTSAVGNAVLEALARHQVRYIVVRAPIGQAGNRDVPRDIIVKEFDIYASRPPAQ